MTKAKSIMTPVETSSQVTEIIFVLDRSGSMDPVREDTIGGFNSYLEDQSKEEGEAFVTLVQFDHEYSTTYRGINIKDADRLSDNNYQPRGSTALLDAVGRTLTEVHSRWRSTPTNKRPQQVLFVVITDGYENSSKEFSKDKIKEMIDARTKDGWQFIYLGADQDAFAEAGGLGFQKGNVANYVGTSRGSEVMWSALSNKTSCYRTSSVASTENFFEGNTTLTEDTITTDSTAPQGDDSH